MRTCNLEGQIAESEEVSEDVLLRGVEREVKREQGGRLFYGSCHSAHPQFQGAAAAAVGISACQAHQRTTPAALPAKRTAGTRSPPSAPAHLFTRGPASCSSGAWPWSGLALYAAHRSLNPTSSAVTLGGLVRGSAPFMSRHSSVPVLSPATEQGAGVGAAS